MGWTSHKSFPGKCSVHFWISLIERMMKYEYKCLDVWVSSDIVITASWVAVPCLQSSYQTALAVTSLSVTARHKCWSRERDKGKGKFSERPAGKMNDGALKLGLLSSVVGFHNYTVFIRNCSNSQGRRRGGRGWGERRWDLCFIPACDAVGSTLLSGWVLHASWLPIFVYCWVPSLKAITKGEGRGRHGSHPGGNCSPWEPNITPLSGFACSRPWE